jgi:hypothetical protein
MPVNVPTMIQPSSPQGQARRDASAKANMSPIFITGYSPIISRKWE